MKIFVLIERDFSVRLFSQPPTDPFRYPGSHCYSCDGDISITTLRNFLVSTISYIRAGTSKFVTIEGFTLVY